jgi:adenylosuccinate synthase
MAEQALVAGIGSTGKGGGAAAARRILGRTPDRVDVPVRLARNVPELTPYLRSARDVLDEAYRNNDRVLLEGTQGTGLSLYHGDYPYVTSRDTTTSGTLAEAGIGPRRVRRVILVCRTYPIRVQNPDRDGTTSGPMSQEIGYEVLADRSGISIEKLLDTEKGSVSQRQRRVAEFDWAQLRRSVELNGATDIALTFADYLDVSNRKRATLRPADRRHHPLHRGGRTGFRRPGQPNHHPVRRPVGYRPSPMVAPPRLPTPTATRVGRMGWPV